MIEENEDKYGRVALRTKYIRASSRTRQPPTSDEEESKPPRRTRTRQNRDVEERGSATFRSKGRKRQAATIRNEDERQNRPTLDRRDEDKPGVRGDEQRVEIEEERGSRPQSEQRTNDGRRYVKRNEQSNRVTRSSDEAIRRLGKQEDRRTSRPRRVTRTQRPANESDENEASTTLDRRRDKHRNMQSGEQQTDRTVGTKDEAHAHDRTRNEASLQSRYEETKGNRDVRSRRREQYAANRIRGREQIDRVGNTRTEANTRPLGEDRKKHKYASELRRKDRGTITPRFWSRTKGSRNKRIRSEDEAKYASSQKVTREQKDKSADVGSKDEGNTTASVEERGHHRDQVRGTRYNYTAVVSRRTKKKQPQITRYENDDQNRPRNSTKDEEQSSTESTRNRAYADSWYETRQIASRYWRERGNRQQLRYEKNEGKYAANGQEDEDKYADAVERQRDRSRTKVIRRVGRDESNRPRQGLENEDIRSVGEDEDNRRVGSREDEEQISRNVGQRNEDIRPALLEARAISRVERKRQKSNHRVRYQRGREQSPQIGRDEGNQPRSDQADRQYDPQLA
ncbi:hypothetical protein C7M84_003096 [Penaeus vannamei]|uniref:Uncharacterized protein n=1 Tax=Penaeus vannamei TaxID=6689 RepID=A0A3R7QGJ5_PENVA|nr:hypothetical protein C7M84_003096 [Penaeus vannamei]